MTDTAKPAVYCSTSGTFFTDKDELTEHYKSDFHRYNLKRKVAGLPPVTREWFNSRKQQLSSSAASFSAQKIWLDPLTKKRFSSENTYSAFVRSKKYQELLRKSDQPPPLPIITIRKIEDAELQPAESISGQQPKPYTLKAPNGPALNEDADDIGSEWETASEEEGEDDINHRGGTSQEPQEWDLRRSLFDNHISESLEGNLEYMWKHFGFYLPDSEYLTDPQGLIQYLGAKLADGHIPLYASGLDSSSKQLSSLHAAQRHMVDTNQCKMAYDGVEEEYEDFYDYSPALTVNEEQQISVLGADQLAVYGPGGYELVVPNANGRGSKLLGTRDFARFYKQKHRSDDTRRSTQVSRMHQRYRNLGVALIESPGEVQAKRAARQAQKQQQKGKRLSLKTDLQSNVNRNLPRNVTY